MNHVPANVCTQDNFTHVNLPINPMKSSEKTLRKKDIY